MRARSWIAASIALGLGATVVAKPGVAEDAWRTADPRYAWSFPRDHWAHPDYRSEWWYLTGSLEAPNGRLFGYQVTFFRIGLATGDPGLASAWSARSVVMGHAAITDVAHNQHVFAEAVYRTAPFLAGFGEHPDPVIAWCLAPPGTSGRWELRWNGEAFDMVVSDSLQGFALALETHPAKPLVFEGPNGLSTKSPEGTASQYYSFTRLATRGTLTRGDERLTVSGESWMDKEFSTSQLSDEQVGWNWFGLRLADGREVMLFEMRRKDGRVDLSSGTLVDPEGRARYLAAGEFTAEALGSWKSPHTGSTYPSRWRVRIPSAGLDLEVVPSVEDQENVAKRSRLRYWEGLVEVRTPDGGPAGRGYVELTGYGRDNRPPL